MGQLPPPPGADERPVPSPWRIGWFGNLRCQRSLAYLAELASRMDGLVEIDLRGSIALPLQEMIGDALSRSPHMRFHGRYTHEELHDHYAAVHFAWAIDFYEAGLNSEWLLPNRLYEGCAFGAIPIAMAEVETGRWLKTHAIGVCLDEMEDAEAQLATMSVERYAALSRAVTSLPRELFVADRDECVRLVEQLVRAERRHGNEQRSGAALA